MPHPLSDHLCLDDAWSRVARQSSIELVKSNAQRRVYRLTHPARVYYVKQHLRRGIIARIKDALLGDPARREFNAGCYAAAHSVPTVTMAAWCVRNLSGGRRAAALVTLGEKDAVGLAQSWDDALQPAHGSNSRAAVRALTLALARLIAQAHDEAFLHTDNHPGNILVRRGEDGGPLCLYVDLYGARCGRPVTSAEAARNIAALDQWFRTRATRADRLRFLKTYTGLRRRRLSADAFKAFARRIDHAAARHAQRLYAQRDRRIGRRNAFFDRQVAEDGAVVVATRRFRDLPQRLGVPAPEDAAAPAGTDAAQRLAAPDTGESFFAPNRLVGLAWRFAGSPAWRKYRSAGLLLNRDIPTVIPLACRWTLGRGTVRQCGWRRLRPPDATALREWLEVVEGRARADLLDRVARLLADTLARGAVVHDPSALTIEVTGVLRGAPCAYWAGTQVSAVAVPAPRHVRVWMLGQLARSVAGDRTVTRADRARVLRTFCRRWGVTQWAGGWRGLWRELVANPF